MKQHYVPDLVEMAATCEANYMRMIKLLPNLDESEDHDYSITGGPHHRTSITFSVEEQFPYTTTIQVQQNASLSEFLRPPKMEVRLYHDAKMAEVISFHNNHRFNGVYRYPNPQMRMPDEKNQVNLFLADWLKHCLEHGEANISLNFMPKVPKCDSSTRSD